MRYVAKYHTTKRLWFVFDTLNQTWGAYGSCSKNTANRRVDKLNGEILAAKARMKTDYGLIYNGLAPAPRAYKDD